MSLEGSKAEMKMLAMGQRFRAGHAKAEPLGDRMINSVRGALREALEMGMDKSDHVAPSEPTSEREPEPEEPEL
jgi:hypothetical protein